MSGRPKPGRSASVDSATKMFEYLPDDKASKKKLKKERQKDKKNHGKPMPEFYGETETDEPFVQEDDWGAIDTGHKSSRSDDDDESTDLDYSTMSQSAFMRSIASKNDSVKHRRKQEAGRSRDSSRSASQKANRNSTDNGDGFTSVTKGGKVAPAVFNKTPEGFGNEALRIIRDGNYTLAIDYLSRAIDLDRYDSRHYINRSYCFLRVGEFDRALSDIQFASKNFVDATEKSRAKCREGQAYCGLQNYEAAERAFNESIDIAPDFLWAYREMKRMQVLQLIHMGFNERDALLALQKHSSTMEALNALTEGTVPASTNYQSSESDVEDEDELFYSDSEDNPSNERLLSKILNYDPNLPEEPRFYEPPPIHKDIVNKVKPTPRVITALGTPTKTVKKPNQTVNDKAVWVGSLTAAMTEAMLQKRFSKFGKVIGVWRSPTENYGFVNFQCATGPHQALEEARYNGGTITMNGMKLTINEATKASK